MGGSCVALAPVDRHHVAEVARQRPPHLRRAAYTILQVEGSSSSINSIQEKYFHFGSSVYRVDT